jgi:hypothetical protein
MNKKPRFTYVHNPSLLFMYDTYEDDKDPNRFLHAKTPWLHWLAMKEANQITDIVPFCPPHPPPGHLRHHYHIDEFNLNSMENKQVVQLLGTLTNKDAHCHPLHSDIWHKYQNLLARPNGNFKTRHSRVITWPL